jgi:hypothetical protein
MRKGKDDAAYADFVEDDVEVPSSNVDPKSGDDASKQASFHFPKVPHPSLEFTPLYITLSSSCFLPGVRDGIRSLYNWRWSISYPLQKQLKGSRLLKKMHIFLTYGEVVIFTPLFILALVCVYQTLLSPNVHCAGRAA